MPTDERAAPDGPFLPDPPDPSPADFPPAQVPPRLSEQYVLNTIRAAPELQRLIEALDSGEIPADQPGTVITAVNEFMERLVMVPLGTEVWRLCAGYGEAARGLSPEQRQQQVEEVYAEARAELHVVEYDARRWRTFRQYLRHLAQRGYDRVRGSETVRITVRPQPEEPGEGPARARVPRACPLPPDYDAVARCPPPIDRAASAEFVQRLRELLDPHEMELIKAFYFEGQSLTELATAAGVSKGAMFKRHQRVLDKLRTRLGDSWGDM